MLLLMWLSGAHFLCILGSPYINGMASPVFVLFQLLQILYNLFVATGRISTYCLLGVSITKQISDFGVTVRCF